MSILQHQIVAGQTDREIDHSQAGRLEHRRAPFKGVGREREQAMAEDEVKTLERARGDFRLDEQTLRNQFLARLAFQQRNEKGGRLGADASIQITAPMKEPPRFILKGERMKTDFGARDNLPHDVLWSKDH